MNLKLPKAKATEIVVQDSGAEILVYDLKTNRAYCLNETAACIYRYCDGKNTFDDVRSELNKDFTDELILLVLKELVEHELLQESDSVNCISTVSRRSIFRKVALASVAMPVITTMVAPRAVVAQSNYCSTYTTETECTANGCTFAFGECSLTPILP
ncbi:MAG: hypothetical protein ACK5NT_08240 [Pyrinomonadaceae bacterium]